MDPPHHEVGDSRLRLRRGASDYDTFAGCEPVGFHHDSPARSAHVGNRVTRVVERFEIRGGYLPPAHEGFGERLAGFDLGRGGTRSEHLQSLRREGVGQARGERGFRTHDGEADAKVGGSGRERCDIGGSNGKTGCERGDAGVAWCCVYLNPATLGEPPRQGVFSAAGPHHENLQQTRPC